MLTKKILSALVALAMTLTALPAALAEEAAKPDYGWELWSDGKPVQKQSSGLYGPFDLGELKYGYSDADADELKATFSVVNTGSRPVILSKMYGNGRFVLDPLDVLIVPEGESKEFTVKPKTGLAGGEYTEMIGYMDQGRRSAVVLTFKLTVTKDKAVVTPASVEKEYGRTLTSADVGFTVADENGGELPAFKKELVSFSSEGFDSGAAVSEKVYPFTLSYGGDDYDVSVAEKAASVGVKVTQATPEMEVINATGVAAGSKLSDSKLTGRFENHYTNEYIPGELKWVNGEQEVTEGEKEYEYIFVPEDKVNYKNATGKVKVIVSEMKPTKLEVESAENLTVDYDGQAHEVRFVTDRPEAEMKVTYSALKSDETYDTPVTAAPKAAGTYKVEATIETDATHASGYAEAVLVIKKKYLHLSALSMSGISVMYNGRTGISQNNITNFNNLIQLYFPVKGDSVSLDRSKVTAEFLDPNVGSDKTIRLTVDKDALIGADAANYYITSGAAVILHTTGKITPFNGIKVTVLRDIEKEYGATLDLSSYVNNNAYVSVAKRPEDNIDDILIRLTSDGTAAEAEVGDYDIAASTAEGSNYVIGATEYRGKLKVVKTTPETYGVTTDEGRIGNTLESVLLKGSFGNPHSHEPVEGALAWDDPQEKLSVGTKYKWTFTPNDDKNYNTVTGEAEITLKEKEPAPIEITKPENVVYDGKAKAVTATTTVSDAEVKVEYAPHTSDSEPEWSMNAPTEAGAYDVRITVTVPENDKTHADNTITETMVITPAEPTRDGEVTASAVDMNDPILARSQLTGKFTGIDGTVLDGQFSWKAENGFYPDTVTVESGKEYDWVFLPASPNYASVSGKAAVNVNYRRIPDENVEIYNLNGDDGNYAYVKVDGENLKVGDTVRFYSKQGEAYNPESIGVAVGDGDEEIRVGLDGDALAAKAGTVYVSIENSGLYTEVNYKDEVGFTLSPADAVNLSAAQAAAEVSIVNSGGYEIDHVNWAVNNADAVSVDGDNASATVTRVGFGTALLTVQVFFKHPDARVGGTVELSATLPIYASTELPELTPALGWDEESGNFTVDFLFGEFDFTALKNVKYGIRITAETEQGPKTAYTELSDQDLAGKGVSVLQSNTNLIYRAAMVVTSGADDGYSVEGNLTAPAAVYGLVADAVEAMANGADTIAAGQLEAATAVLNNGGLYLIKADDGSYGLTKEAAKLMTVDGDTITIKENVAKAGLKFAENIAAESSDGDKPKVTVAADGRSVTVDGLAAAEEAVIYLESVEFVLDADAAETDADEAVSGELDFVEEV